MVTEENDGTGEPRSPSTGMLVAAVLCWFVGGMTVKITLSSGFPITSVIANLAAGSAVIAAGFLALKRRRASLFLILLCWGYALVVSMVTDTPPKLGSTLMLIALLALGANWRHLH